MWAGIDYQVTKELFIKHPKINEILEIGQDKYNQYVSVLTFEPIHMADILWQESKIWYTDVKAWDMFVQTLYGENNQSDKIVSEALLYFTGCDWKLKINTNTNEVLLHNEDKNLMINELTFNLISQYLREINFIMEADIYYQLRHAGSKGTAKYIMQQISKKRKLKSNNDIDLRSICSSLMWKSGIGEELLNYPIYRIYEGYARLNAIDNWDKTVTAYYAGTIDTEKQKVNFEKINWSKILDKL